MRFCLPFQVLESQCHPFQHRVSTLALPAMMRHPSHHVCTCFGHKCTTYIRHSRFTWYEPKPQVPSTSRQKVVMSRAFADLVRVSRHTPQFQWYMSVLTVESGTAVLTNRLGCARRQQNTGRGHHCFTFQGSHPSHGMIPSESVPAPHRSLLPPFRSSTVTHM